MIVYDLRCTKGHRFEGWFASSDAFVEQSTKGLVVCAYCECKDISKAPMAPTVRTDARSASEQNKPEVMESASQKVANVPSSISSEMRKALVGLAKAQAKALKNSDWVGDKFAEKSRAMYYGEEQSASIHGRTSPEEVRSLHEDGIGVMPLIIPVVPPDELN